MQSPVLGEGSFHLLAGALSPNPAYPPSELGWTTVEPTVTFWIFSLQGGKASPKPASQKNKEEVYEEGS